jgi:hypothetical protein
MALHAVQGDGLGFEKGQQSLFATLIRVVGEHGVVEAIHRIVSDFDGVRFVVHRNDAQHRAKYFLARQRGVIVDVAGG